MYFNTNLYKINIVCNLYRGWPISTFYGGEQLVQFKEFVRTSNTTVTAGFNIYTVPFGRYAKVNVKRLTSTGGSFRINFKATGINSDVSGTVTSFNNSYSVNLSEGDVLFYNLISTSPVNYFIEVKEYLIP